MASSMSDNSTNSTLDWWPSPAKLNLFLHINGRYDNGYHQLQSLFQILDFGDELAFEVNDSGAVELATPIEGVANDDNLIVKAARLLHQQMQLKHGQHQHCQTHTGVVIHLKKRLPMGGGIGGGSSNAATTLVALNHLWQCGFSEDELAELGLRLGADVPIFVRGKTAFAEGVGEIIQPVALTPQHYLVVTPNVHVSTADIFTATELPRNTPKIDFSAYNFDNTHNDCQEIVCNRHNEVAKILHWLLQFAPSRMTGTGASVFAVFNSLPKALEVQQNLPSTWQSFVASGVNTSQLQQKLQSIVARYV